MHPAPDANDIFGSLRQEANAWLIVHLGSLLFIGLTGAVLYMLVRELHGSIAVLAKVAIGTFVLFYGAAEAIPTPWGLERRPARHEVPV